MIDEGVFRDAWGLLKERFDREVSDLQMRMYFSTVGDRLDTDQFKRAIRQLYYEARFFPTPREIVDAGLDRDPGREAEREWERVLARRDAMARGDVQDDDDRPSPAALRALRQVGGMDALRNAKATSIRRFRSAFLDAYEALRPRDPAPGLPTGDAPPRLTGDDDG